MIAGATGLSLSIWVEVLTPHGTTKCGNGLDGSGKSDLLSEPEVGSTSTVDMTLGTVWNLAFDCHSD